MEIVSNVILNLQTPAYSTVYAPQGDTLTRKVRAQLMDGSTPWEVPDGATMVIRYRKPDGTVGYYDTDELGNAAYTVSGEYVTFTLAAQSMTVAGAVYMQLDFYAANDQHLSTFTLTLNVSAAVVADGEIASEDYINALTRTAAQIAQDMHIYYGAPRTAASAADMTDHDLVYVYTGTTGGGLTNGHWYYYNGSAWTDGGVYNSTAFTTDTTLTVAGAAADAKVTGDAIGDVKSATETQTRELSGCEVVPIVNNTYINLSGATVEMVDGIPSYSGISYVYACGIMPCVSGDIFTVNGKGGENTRLYGFISSTGEILSVAPESATRENLLVEAPASSAWFICHNYIRDGEEAYCYKGITPRKYIDLALRDYDGSAPANSVAELPDNVRWDVSASTLQPLLGANFTWSLTSGTTYVLTVKRITSSYRRYELSSVGGSVYWTGGKADSATDINWYTTMPDTTLTANNTPANSKSVGNGLLAISRLNTNVFELYTDFELLQGWWKTDGTRHNLTIQSHTQNLRVRPNTTYYVSVLPSITDVFCALFDLYGNFIGTLSVTNDISEYSYTIPNADPGSSMTDYAKLYQFTTPENVAYVSLNWNKTDPKKADVDYDNRFDIYRNFLSSKPVFALMNTGNFQVKKDNEIYQKYKNRKLCVIGSSPVMIDRLYRAANNHEYIVGFQEYLVPWWNEVRSFGYSSASYRKYDVEDGAGVRSIYSRIITDQLDLSGYDDYLLVANGNGVTGHIGTLTSYDDLGTATECMGGMRQIIDYIYQQNPDAMIYVQTMRYQGSWATTSRDTVVQLNSEIRKMAEMLSLGLVDNAYDSGINQYNSERYSYDGGSHCNQIGNKIQGLCVRKAILGF